MTAWIPLFQSLVWPVFVLVVAVVWRQRLGAVLEAMRARIERGDAFEAGASGIKLGAATPPTIPHTAPEKGAQPLPGTGPAHLLVARAATNAVARDDDNEAPPEDEREEAERTYYLVHKARHDRTLDRGETRYYRLSVYLDTDDPADIAQVTKVVYHLHPSFPNARREVADEATQFRLETAAWGEFNLTAEVFLRDQPEALHLQRYLNF